MCKTGIYLLETKEWEEKLIHGLTKENAGIYSFMIDEMGKYQQEIEKEETFEYIVGKDSSTIQVKNEGNPVYRAKKLSQILYSALKEMQANSIKEKVKPVVYFYKLKMEKQIVDLSSEETPRLKDREQIVTFFRNEILAGEVVYTVQELEQIQEMISRMNYIVS